MLSYEVIVNGERIAVAGVHDWAVMSVIVSATRGDDKQGREPDHSVALAGLTEGGYHTRWKGADLEIGSEVIVRAIDCSAPDAPARQYRYDGGRFESDLTDDEKRAMRYQSYLELKAEFEP